ncbi:plasmid stabilization system protein ParE [Amaricoccus macauensis]|uniref:Plasmid stabilization system protein ParE n=1 Tax=Amaricoccus macauensis TaxID=57001 RepID=A0A840SL62_9RHOB|nr:type II toxin-antitoxin system RelE/ParE family toxin [Amaricoccus macauensis]MBB5221365.1 plasmid stabilization system protein ParE [Amaricoccus macauensis]
MAHVRFSRQALADLAGIHAWLTERSPAAAGRVIAAIEASVTLLADHPAMGRREERGLGRILIVPRYGYVVSYRVTGDAVEILYVFHPSRDR